jgi:hypothetical protein
VYGADSDVDIVLRSKSFFYYKIDDLPDPQKTEFKRFHPNLSEYTLTNFRTDVMAWLQKNYGNDLDVSGKKALRLKANGNRRDADILLVAPHKRFIRYINEQDCAYVEGVIFIATDGTSIINYPKQHSENMIPGPL